MADDDDRPRDASGAANPLWPEVVVPDDISALAADVDAYRRELRARRRRQRVDRILSRRIAAHLLVASSALLLAAVVTLLLTALAPQRSEAPPAAPLATDPGRAGTIGGLLPQASLGRDGVQVPSRSLRPAVLALVPPHCGCGPLLETVSGQAWSERLPLDVVAPAAEDQELTDLLRGIHLGSPVLYGDAAGALRRGTGATGTTLVVVNRDGTIADVIPSATAAVARSRLVAELQTMFQSRPSR